MDDDGYHGTLIGQTLGLAALCAVLLTIYHLRQGVPLQAIIDDPALLVRGMFDH